MTKRTKKASASIQMGVLCILAFGFAFIVKFAAPTGQRPAKAVQVARHHGDRFVFADFDGDHKPDLALVEMQGPSTEPVNYSIRLQFSRGGAQSAIGLQGPFGGLQVAARDVNGDDNLDLVFTSSLDASFVAVLLNDGHGNFSVASAEVLAKERESESALRSPSGPELGQSTLVSLRSSMEEGFASERGHCQVSSGTGGPQFAVDPELRQPVLRRSGRSPPPQFFL